MLTIILLVAFCLDLSQTLTFQLPVNEDSSALTVTNFSDTSVRLNWTGAQDLLADSLKMKCRGSREYIDTNGVLAIDKIVRTHYYSLDAAFSAGLLGDLKPNMQFVCTVSIYYQDRKIISEKIEFSTAVSAPEPPQEPIIKPGSIPGDYTVHLFNTSTRHGPVSGYEIQFHMMDNATISNNRPMIHENQFKPFGSLVTIDEARESFEPVSFFIRSEILSPKLAINRGDLLQGALKKGSSYSVVTVAYQDETPGSLYSHSNTSSIISISLKLTGKHNSNGKQWVSIMSQTFRSRFGKALFFMGTAGLPVFVVIITVGALVVCCKMRYKLFSRDKHNYRRLSTKKTFHHFPRPDPLAKITPIRYSTQENPSQSNLFGSPTTGNNLSIHSMRPKKPSHKDSHLIHHHKKYSSKSQRHTRHYNEVSHAHYQNQTLNAQDHSIYHQKKLPNYTAQFPYHSTVKNTPKTRKKLPSPLFEIDCPPPPIRPSPICPPPLDLPSPPSISSTASPPPLPPSSWPLTTRLVIEAEMHSVPQQSSYSFHATTRPPEPNDITDTVVPLNLPEGNNVQSDYENPLSVSSQYDTPPLSIAHKQRTDSTLSLSSDLMATPLTSPLHNEQNPSSGIQSLPMSTPFVPSQVRNDDSSVPSYEHREGDHYSSAPYHNDHSSHHSSLDSVDIDTASRHSESEPHTRFSDVVHRPCAPLPTENLNLQSFFNTTLFPSVPMLRAIFSTSGRRRSLSFTGPPLSRAHSQRAGYSHDNVKPEARKRAESMPLLHSKKESNELLCYLNLPIDPDYDNEDSRSRFRKNHEMQAGNNNSLTGCKASVSLPERTPPYQIKEHNNHWSSLSPTQPINPLDTSWPNTQVSNTTPVSPPAVQSSAKNALGTTSDKAKNIIN